MALRDQPYLPLYVKDFLTDEKLAECSARSTGVYIRLMCILHKQEDYGQLKLTEKYTSDDDIENFTNMLLKQMPYDYKTIYESLKELLKEKVIFFQKKTLKQQRMIKDDKLSKTRAKSGKQRWNLHMQNLSKSLAKGYANTEYEIDIDNNNINNNKLYIYLESLFSRTFNGIECELINTWEDTELTRYAIKQSVLNNVYNLKYIDAILKTYKQKNITTVQQAMEEDKKFQESKSQPKKGYETKFDRQRRVKERLGLLDESS